MFGSQVVECRKQQFNRTYCDNTCYNRHQNGFTEKLCRKLKTMSAQCFTYGNFLSSAFGACRRKIHEIDAGNTQGEKCNNGKDINTILVTLISRDFRPCTICTSIQMNFRHRLETEFPFAIDYLRTLMQSSDIRQLPIKADIERVRAELYIGIKVEVTPFCSKDMKHINIFY